MEQDSIIQTGYDVRWDGSEIVDGRWDHLARPIAFTVGAGQTEKDGPRATRKAHAGCVLMETIAYPQRHLSPLTPSSLERTTVLVRPLTAPVKQSPDVAGRKDIANKTEPQKLREAIEQTKLEPDFVHSDNWPQTLGEAKNTRNNWRRRDHETKTRS